MPNALMLLTATVDPPRATPKLALSNARLRECQYYHALRRWCDVLPSNWTILVAENSGWPSHGFHAIGQEHGREVHFIPCVDKGSQFGKGVGEAGLIDEVLSSGAVDGYSWIVKCTGRLHVRNFNSAMPEIPDRSAVCALITPTLSYMDSRLFGGTADVFERHFREMGNDIDEAGGTYFEHVAARRLLTSISAGATFQPFAALPRFQGESASMGRSYNGIRAEIKWILHQEARKLVLRRSMSI